MSSYLELPGFTDPFARYLESGRAYVRFAIEHPQLYRATMLPLDPGADLTAELEDAAERTFDQLQGIVEEAMSVGAIRTGDAYAVAITSWTVAHGIAMLLIDGQLPRKHPGRTPEEIADAIFTRMYFGLHP